MIKLRNKLVSIPLDKLANELNKPIHFSWAASGCVWILDRIDGEKVYVHTPKTNRKGIYKAKDACYTRLREPKQ